MTINTAERIEIVLVMDDSKLVDSEHFQRPYTHGEGRALAPGYYVVTWPAHIRAGRFNEDARFQGPYRRRPEARAAVERSAGKADADRLAFADRNPAFCRARSARGLGHCPS